MNEPFIFGRSLIARNSGIEKTFRKKKKEREREREREREKRVDTPHVSVCLSVCLSQ